MLSGVNLGVGLSCLKYPEDVKWGKLSGGSQLLEVSGGC